MIFGLIPAGGKSSRMGCPKLSLRLGGRTVLEHVIAALRGGGVGHVLVVVGSHAPELMPCAEAAGARVCLLPEETADMRATVQHGLRWLEEHLQACAGDAWLLVPADHPALDAGVVRALLETHAESPSASIVIPTYTGRRGHPTLIGWQHVPDILALPPEEGINAYLRRQAAHTLELPVQTPGVLVDLDVPEDYERLRRQWPHA